MRTIKLLPVLLLAVVCMMSSCQSDQPAHRSKLLSFDAQIDTILSKMTLEEKVAMMHGKHMFTSEGVPRFGIADIVYADGPFGIREEMEPHSWNSLHLANDSSTFFPTGSALAATWSYEAAYAYGTGMAREARLRGKDMILGPAINIQRLPTGGRTYEYFSEDPLLSSALSLGYTLGVQDNGVAVCLKHYALNNQENDRGTVDVIADERTMREIYLPPFERAVVEGDAYGVMAAYNKVNGYWCSENAVLLDSILRQDWGFAGIVISDWGGTHSTVRAVESGLNVEMPGNRYLGQALLDSVKAGIVSEAVINERVRELLRVRMAIKPIPAEQANVTMTAKPEQAKIAYDVAIKSMVLLKNEGSLLPLDLNKYKKIAVIGENAVRTMGLGGVGAGVKAYNEITPLKGLQDRIGNKAELLYAQGYQGFTRSWGRRGPSSPYHDADPKLMEEAVKVAKDADLVLFIGGNNREVETEGSDRTSIQLPAGQDQLLQALVAANPNVVTVIVAGAPTDLTTVKEISPAIVYSWLSGSEGGHALADILLGAVAPSGKLPMTFPKKLEDSPAYALKNYPQVREAGDDVFVDLTQNRQRRQAPAVHADYSEGLLVGYRWFDTKDVEPLYPFGFGLSYTTFNYANIATDKAKYSSKESIQVTFELSNTGSVAAEEVVQLYVTREDGQVEWPEKELKAFDRVNLKPSETKSVTLSVPVSSLRYWDEATHDWQLEHSTLNIAVGASSRDIKLNTSVQI